jgi:enoyl-CoA hydratase
MAFDNLLLERDGAVAVVTINRPKVLNALNSATVTSSAARCSS